MLKQYNLSLEISTVTQQENVNLFPNLLLQFLLYRYTEHIFSLVIFSTTGLLYQDRVPISPL